MGIFGVMIAVFAVLIFLGMPIAITLGIAVLAGLFLKGVPLVFISQTCFTGLDSFSFLAIPMFILAGYLMDTGGISKRIVNFANSLVGNVYGGLGIVTIMACMFFAAISGSAPATVAAVGTMMIPTMVAKGYDVNFAGALTACSGSLGIVIPPSIPMIIYAVLAGVSVEKMFTAGFIPGALIGLVLILTTYFTARKKGYKSNEGKFSFPRVWTTLKDSIWAIFTPIIVLGGIYAGIVTATEASVISVLYALVVGIFIHKELKVTDLGDIFIKAAISAGTIMILFGFATCFARFITLIKIPQLLGNFILHYTNDANLIFVLFSVLVFFTGMFIDAGPIILLYTPLFLPILVNLGIDPIHFGIVLIVGCQLGFITPPVGVNLFVVQGITGTPIVDLSKKIVLFLASMIVVQLLLIFVPDLVLTLPRLLGR